jgi:tetratricopeptide (TPR) repeat protein
MKSKLTCLVLLAAATAIPNTAAANAIGYEINFTLASGSPAPASGSFSYDPDFPGTFSDFTVIWDSFTFDESHSANEPNHGPGCLGVECLGAYGYLLMTQTLTASSLAYQWEASAFPANTPQFAFAAYQLPNSFARIMGTAGLQIPTPNAALAAGGWTVTPVTAPIPEPGTIGLTLVGLGALVRKRIVPAIRKATRTSRPWRREWALGRESPGPNSLQVLAMRKILLICCAGLAFAGQGDWQKRMLQANSLDREGRYGEAEALYVASVDEAEKSGTTGRWLAESLNNLAAHHFLCGNYAAAEPLYRRALETWRAGGEDLERDLASPMINLAALYRALGRYAEAERLYTAALPMLEPDTSRIRNDLAELYRAEGKYKAAESMARAALEISARDGGVGSAGVAAALHTLAAVYGDLHRHDDALTLLERCLRIRERLFGPEHPLSVATLGNIAVSLIAQGRLAEAEPLARRVLEIRQKTLGREHPDVAVSLNNLAQVARLQGRYIEAEPLYRRALTIWEKKLGPDHPAVANGLCNLADFYHERGRESAAESLYARALSILEKSLGSGHPQVSIVSVRMAEVYRAQGRQRKAQKITASVNALR